MARGEERKIVTILFVDVVGSTRNATAVDPERVRAQMARFFEIARQEIHRYDGTVEKYVGDAVMAAFGLPAVHEDDPERAARAAVALRDRLSAEARVGALPQVRMGIDMGEVIANPMAVAAGEFLLTGETANLAARLQQHAGPGQIFVGDRAAQALQHMARLRPVPPLTAKGVKTPLAAWELLEVVPPRERELRATPFVGRDEDLNLLDGYLRRMRCEGHGYLITIIGAAGVGKTRLAQELRERAGAMRVLRGRALPYGMGVPFWALGEAMRDECGILFGDPLETARQKLADTAARLEIPEAVPALMAALGFGGEAHELTREVLFRAMLSFLEAVSRRAPLLLILEDTHCADDATLDFLEHTAGALRGMSVLVLVLARPELLERWPQWMGGRRNTAVLTLDLLGEAASRALVDGFFGGRTVPAPVVDLVLKHAEGNPLFIEEILRVLIEQAMITATDGRWELAVPLSEVTIPENVHAVVAARIDALPGPEKQALQAAAIVGKDFWLGAVRHLTDESGLDVAVQGLVEKDVLVRKRGSTLLGEDEFTFRHLLLRDVAYATIPKAQRWVLHARCAEWQQMVAEDRQSEWADYIAHHWLQVVTLRRDLGMSPDPRALAQAVANLLLAGDRAAGLYANTAALDHYSRALELAPPSPERFRALLGRGDTWMLLGQHAPAREDFAAVRALAQEVGDPRWEAVALDRLGQSYRRQDRISRALEHFESALALSRKAGDPSLTGRILNHIGFVYFNVAKFEEALRPHEEARHLFEATGELAGLAESLNGLGENALWLGRSQEGFRWCSESAKIGVQIGNRSLAGENWYMIAANRDILGDYVAAQADADRSIAVLTEIGDVWNLSFALMVAAGIATHLGEFGKVLEYTTRSLDLARQITAGRQTMLCLTARGDVLRELEDVHGAWQADREAAELARTGEFGAYWAARRRAYLALDAAALGRTDEALAYIEDARRALASGQRFDSEAEVIHAEGRVLLTLGQAEAARDTATALDEAVASSGTLSFRVLALLLSADSTAALGHTEAAAKTYGEAVEEAERTGRTPVLWRALAGLAEVQRKLGRAQESAASAMRAKAVIDRLSATVPDERLRANFQQSAKVQRVVALADA
jgi:class 3 adenylate cyclase/tetratricopeptide (TPR) repeat protein